MGHGHLKYPIANHRGRMDDFGCSWARKEGKASPLRSSIFVDLRSMPTRALGVSRCSNIRWSARGQLAGWPGFYQQFSRHPVIVLFRLAPCERTLSGSISSRNILRRGRVYIFFTVPFFTEDKLFFTFCSNMGSTCIFMRWVQIRWERFQVEWRKNRTILHKEMFISRMLLCRKILFFSSFFRKLKI